MSFLPHNSTPVVSVMLCNVNKNTARKIMMMKEVNKSNNHNVCARQERMKKCLQLYYYKKGRYVGKKYQQEVRARRRKSAFW